ncbi:MAG TPA: response regulator transcription factor [Terriglobales bacterium]|nr:response regulator transcription factor [Terriglobales bacterium]
MGEPAASRGGNVSILLADSNQVQRELLSTALRRQRAFHVVSCSAELAPCLARLQSGHPDVLLLGLASLNGDGLHYELIRSLHSSCPKAAIVLLLYEYDRDLVIEALRAGARGLFCLASRFKDLCRCIHAVHAGQFWVNTEQFAYVIDSLVQAPSLHATDVNGHRLLTAREEQIVTLVAEGLGNRHIAQKLEITENTVKKALLRIFDKLGISNRVELVLYVLTHRPSESPALPVEPRSPEPIKVAVAAQHYERKSPALAAPLIAFPSIARS